MKRFLLTTAALVAMNLAPTTVLAEHHETDKKDAEITIKANASEHYVFDKAHTQILFFVNHLGFSMSQGEFLDYDGHIVFDEEQPEKSSIDVTIKTASIDMDNEKWDAHMKNEDFFDVEKFPEMTFKSTDIKVTGDKTGEIVGDLTILGVTNPVTLNVTHNKTGIHPYSKKKVIGFSANTKINREEWGMKYGLPNIGNEVEIRLEVEAFKQDVIPSKETTTAE